MRLVISSGGWLLAGESRWAVQAPPLQIYVICYMLQYNLFQHVLIRVGYFFNLQIELTSDQHTNVENKFIDTINVFLNFVEGLSILPSICIKFGIVQLVITWNLYTASMVFHTLSSQCIVPTLVMTSV